MSVDERNRPMESLAKIILDWIVSRFVKWHTVRTADRPEDFHITICFECHKTLINRRGNIVVHCACED